MYWQLSPLIGALFLGLGMQFLNTGAHANPIRWEMADGGNGHLYEVIQDRLTWTEANAAARSRGGYLATLTTAAEHEFVLSLLLTPTGSLNPAYWFPLIGRPFGPWLGARQADDAIHPAEGWSWVTGEPFSFTAWFPEEPNDYTGFSEKYLHFYVYTAVSNVPGWNDQTDIPYREIRAYVVEYVSAPPAAFSILFGVLVLTLHYRRLHLRKA